MNKTGRISSLQYFSILHVALCIFCKSAAHKIHAKNFIRNVGGEEKENEPTLLRLPNSWSRLAMINTLPIKVTSGIPELQVKDRMGVRTRRGQSSVP